MQNGFWIRTSSNGLACGPSPPLRPQAPAVRHNPPAGPPWTARDLIALVPLPSDRHRKRSRMATPRRNRKKRYFTVAEANATLPLLRSILRDVTELAREL